MSKDISPNTYETATYVYKDNKLYARILKNEYSLYIDKKFISKNDEIDEILDILPEGVDLEIMKRSFNTKNKLELFSYLKNPIGNFKFSKSFKAELKEDIVISNLDKKNTFPNILNAKIDIEYESLKADDDLDIKLLNIEMPTTITKATDNIMQMEEMVKSILDNGYGYETSKGIYFDISKLDNYPVLSNNKLEGQEAGARIEVDPEKRNPADFALWIKAPKEHLMKWESPWGLSYPGWHIECSAMSKRFLGEHFDIHTGGVDHIPVHHENEIAQCKGAFGHNPANFWMHVEFLLIDNGKMSKSLHNIYRLEDLQAKGIEPLAYRLFCYSASFRNKLNFTFDGAKAAQTSLNKLRKLYLLNKNSDAKIDNKILLEAENKFHEAVNDDLNLPLAMGIVWDLLKNETKSKQIAELILKFDKILGLDLINSEKYQAEENLDIPEEIELLAKQRLEAKQNKDYKKALQEGFSKYARATRF